MTSSNDFDVTSTVFSPRIATSWLANRTASVMLAAAAGTAATSNDTAFTFRRLGSNWTATSTTRQKAPIQTPFPTLTSSAVDVITNIVLPVIVAVGTVANLFVFALLWRRQRKTSAHVYVSAMTLTSAFVLVAGTGYSWLVDIVQWMHVGNAAEWTCKLWQFAYNVLVYTPNWVLVALLADQTLLARRARAARELCTPCAARLIIVAIVTLLVSVAIHVMWTYELTRSRGCNVNPRRRDFFTTVWPYFSAALYLYVPFVLALVLAVTLAVRLVRTRKRQIAAVVSTSSTTSNTSAQWQQRQSERPAAAHQPRLTLTLAATFVGLLTPGVLLNVVSHVTTVTGVGMDRETLMMAYVVCQLAACLGYSSPPLACLVCDRSLLHQIVHALADLGCCSRVAASAVYDTAATPGIVVMDSPPDNEDVVADDDEMGTHGTATRGNDNNGYTEYRSTLETPSAEVTADFELTSLVTDIEETDV